MTTAMAEPAVRYNCLRNNHDRCYDEGNLHLRNRSCKLGRECAVLPRPRVVATFNQKFWIGDRKSKSPYGEDLLVPVDDFSMFNISSSSLTSSLFSASP